MLLQRSPSGRSDSPDQSCQRKEDHDGELPHPGIHERSINGRRVRLPRVSRKRHTPPTTDSLPNPSCNLPVSERSAPPVRSRELAIEIIDALLVDPEEGDDEEVGTELSDTTNLQLLLRMLWASHYGGLTEVRRADVDNESDAQPFRSGRSK